jgi:hypothetical protein
LGILLSIEILPVYRAFAKASKKAERSQSSAAGASRFGIVAICSYRGLSL